MDTELENLQDHELMHQFQNGDEACFRELVERHKKRVFNLTYRFLNGSSDAEDIAQEVFVKVYFAKSSYKPTAKFTTWLYVITRNTCLQAIKRRGNTISMNEKASNSNETEVQALLTDATAKNPFEKILSAEKRQKIAEAIAKLPETQRMVILLRRYDQLSYEEIAEVLGCSVQAVKSLLFRGRTSLKEHLREYFNEHA
ncbi:MAG: sigma-70 family RNA polymerase sigma factor [Candidatus Rifleibacteriota bacterium]